jgi:hypothetical protein
MRLIDADEAYKIAKESGCHNDFALSLADLTSLREVMEDCPTIEAAPVVHGRWDDECRCTACGWYGEDWYKRDVYHFDYCPNCGAKMDM